MTAQISDRLLYQGKQHEIYGEPLNAYLGQMKNRPRFQVASTALWRGYLCKWAIEDGKLFLLSLQGILENDEVASIKTLFPESSGRVHADWFSGRVGIGPNASPGAPCPRTMPPGRLSSRSPMLTLALVLIYVR